MGPAVCRILALLLPLLAFSAPRPPRLHFAQATKLALARQVLDAMVAGDSLRVQELALSREEFQAYVWPELPVSNPKTNVPIDFVWNDVAFRSANRMRAMLKDLYGRKLRIIDVIQRGKTTEYPSHRAFSDMVVTLQEESGNVRKYPLFGTLIEMDGLFKVYSYAPYD